MGKSFKDRRLSNPDIELEVWVRGVHHGDSGMVDWDVTVVGEDDPEIAAGILERAAEVLRDK